MKWSRQTKSWKKQREPIGLQNGRPDGIIGTVLIQILNPELHGIILLLLFSYQNAVKKVEDWTMQLADEMDSLLALQDKYQTQQGELKTLMAKLEKQKDAYAAELAEAQKQAQDYKKTISKQEAIIRAQEAAAARANANTYDGGGTGASVELQAIPI